MKPIAVSIALFLIYLPSAHAQNTEQQQFEQEAAAAIQELASSLKSALQSVMQDSGPVEAVAVCKLIAPSLAAEISKARGMDIGRTSLKVRNPDNAPDKWETGVLQDFETRLSAGEGIQKLTFSERVETRTGGQWRMMKAIPTSELCLSCHGTNIAEPVQAVLEQYYPDDKAIGFKPGDIRGAFTVKKDIAP